MHHERTTRTERIWVMITDVDDDYGYYTGVIDNDPTHSAAAHGDELQFHPLHIAEIVRQKARTNSHGIRNHLAWTAIDDQQTLKKTASRSDKLLKSVNGFILFDGAFHVRGDAKPRVAFTTPCLGIARCVPSPLSNSQEGRCFHSLKARWATSTSLS